jgi:xanthine dehydrogenase accessory factor
MARAPAEIDPICVENWLRTGTQAVRIEITHVIGSAPRGPGAAMIVSAGGYTGTIGGGALEWALIATAREMLIAGDHCKEIEQALGPEIGQCCGGRVRAVLTRVIDADLRQIRAPAPRPTVYIFGAGHVGAALARALAPLPIAVTIIDQRTALLAPLTAFGLTIETALPEADVVAAAAGSAFVVATHEHALDFLIVEAAIRRGDAAYVGMIGSTSKRAVLAGRLAATGLSDATLICPIGAGDTKDKRPEIIAATTAAELVRVLF